MVQWDPWVFRSLCCIIYELVSKEVTLFVRLIFPLPSSLSTPQTSAALACRWWSDWSGAAGMIKRGVRTIEGTSKALFYTLRITLTCTTHHARTHRTHRTHNRTIAYLRICIPAHIQGMPMVFVVRECQDDGSVTSAFPFFFPFLSLFIISSLFCFRRCVVTCAVTLASTGTPTSTIYRHTIEIWSSYIERKSFFREYNTSFLPRADVLTGRIAGDTGML